MKPITYSLQPVSDQNYYEIISLLADHVEWDGAERVGEWFRRYESFLQQDHPLAGRSRQETLFDWLTLATLWQHYGGQSMRSWSGVLWMLSRLYRLRRRYKKVKRPVDRLRGILATMVISHDKVPAHPPSIKELNRFLLWLDATGEYREEVKRLTLIKSFIATLPAVERLRVFEILDRWAAWFENQSEQALGQFTVNVDPFREGPALLHKWQEDYFFCRRRRVEYHLSMLGAELMNRAFRSLYLTSRQRAVLVPACMREKSSDQCKAKQIDLDWQCTLCSSSCRIAALTRRGKNEGFGVHIIPHSSDFTAWLNRWAKDKGIGVVGVACPLNLITGGLELRGLNIPSQCVPLDYCGCTHHWHDTGIPTDLDEKELDKRLALGITRDRAVSV